MSGARCEQLQLQTPRGKNLSPESTFGYAFHQLWDLHSRYAPGEERLIYRSGRALDYDWDVGRQFRIPRPLAAILCVVGCLPWPASFVMMPLAKRTLVACKPSDCNCFTSLAAMERHNSQGKLFPQRLSNDRPGFGPKVGKRCHWCRTVPTLETQLHCARKSMLELQDPKYHHSDIGFARVCAPLRGLR